MKTQTLRWQFVDRRDIGAIPSHSPACFMWGRLQYKIVLSHHEMGLMAKV